MLFGLERSNKDFSLPATWGKNQFNNCFPAALANYMGQAGIPLVYLTLDQEYVIAKSTITTEQLYTLDPLNSNTFFCFECVYTPWSIFAVNAVPRVDLVIQDLNTPRRDAVRALEIKLTALPDHTTATLSDDHYGCEIVVRPDTIVYLGLSLAELYAADRSSLYKALEPVGSYIRDWSIGTETHPHIRAMAKTLYQILLSKLALQSPLLMQPVWKTKGKLLTLADQCFDIFVWSNFALCKLFANIAYTDPKITRHARTLIWLTKMLWDFAQHGRFSGSDSIENITYNTRNDKAFASSGFVTRQYMASPELTRPRVPKEAVRDIILGGGQKYLSPERRLDAALLGTQGLFPLETL